ncbi:hypothetical protein [Legionella yabuuchiae]|uniref:hypothetical protein n=1 Tax=Legionella yabuuchiae TaxID=376727 RepID=UPI00105500C1|nr:hypothetical protein [Legionella yabuuchiae]
MKSSSFCLFFIAVFFVVRPSVADNALALAYQKGPYQVDSEEYRLPAKIHPEILKDEKTEIWARVFFPSNIKELNSLPLVVMLHGNHATCGRGKNPRIDDNSKYTTTGKCPQGYVVVPNHEGYNYLAKQLASWGVITVSINANRGINGGKSSPDDVALIKARGRLILKHLALLNKWFERGSLSKKLQPKFRQLIRKIDFNRVGLFGHSRGAQGIRAAYALYQEPGSLWQTLIPELSIKALYEIGGTDFPIVNAVTHALDYLNADQVAWNQLLPLCDGDVVDAQGKNPFERMISNYSLMDETQKSLYEVWGANHNFFNTEWQIPDVRFEICAHTDKLYSQEAQGSESQQIIAETSALAFFSAHLLDKKEDFTHFNPLYPLPARLKKITQIDRDYLPSRDLDSIAVVDDFNQATGVNSSGFNNNHHLIRIEHENIDPSFKIKQRAAIIHWENTGDTPFFESVWSAKGQGKDVSSFVTLDFRITRSDSILNTLSTTDFSIHLVDANLKPSNPVKLSEFSLLNGPGSYNEYQFNPIFQTIRIPLTQFDGIDLKNIHAVRFAFDQTLTGSIYLSNIRFNKDYGKGIASTYENRPPIPMRPISIPYSSSTQMVVPEALLVQTPFNKIKAIRVIRPAHPYRADEELVEIHLESREKFIVSDSLPILSIGEKKFMQSRFGEDGNQHEMIFTIPKQEYDQLSGVESVVVSNGKTWLFGKIQE